MREDIANFFPATLELTVSTMATYVILSITLGILSAVNKGRVADFLVRFAVTLGAGAPAFWVGIAREGLWKRAHALAVRDHPAVFVGWITPISNIFSQRVTRYVYHPLEFDGVPYFYGMRLTGR